MNEYYLEKSNRKDKKYMVSWINPKSGRVKSIHFGAKGMSDYTIHKDDERKQRYINRHQKRENFNDLGKSGAWALNILWNKRTLKDSIKDMEKKFNIKINLI